MANNKAAKTIEEKAEKWRLCYKSSVAREVKKDAKIADLKYKIRVLEMRLDALQ